MSIIHKKGKILSPQNKRVHCQAWVPEGTPRGMILLVHGLKDHSGRYMNLVHHFVPRGYALYGFDLPGHGQSEGTRTYIDHFREFTHSLNIYADQVREWLPDVPLFLYGHSMGGLIILHHLAGHPSQYQGAVFSSPLYTEPDHISPALKIAGRLLGWLTPKRRILKINVEGISRDDNVIHQYRNDPLVVEKKTTAKLGVELQKAVDRAPDMAHQITTPALILQGKQDRLVNPQGAEQLYQDLSSSDKTFKSYAGFYHELHNEPKPARQRVFADIEDWLEYHLP